LLHNHPHLSSGAGTIGQKWPQCKGLNPTSLAIKKTGSETENFMEVGQGPNWGCSAKGYHLGCIVNFINLLDVENIYDNGGRTSLYIIGLSMVPVIFGTGQHDVSGSGYRRTFK
jgi:hypothetical protein